MSHNYDVIGSGNYENRILRPKFSRSEYFASIFTEFAYSDGILKIKKSVPSRLTTIGTVFSPSMVVNQTTLELSKVIEIRQQPRDSPYLTITVSNNFTIIHEVILPVNFRSIFRSTFVPRFYLQDFRPLTILCRGLHILYNTQFKQMENRLNVDHVCAILMSDKSEMVLY